MKKIFFIVISIAMICGNISFAQISIERQAIGSTGNLTNSGIIKAYANVGEAIIATFSQSIIIVTQGFEQPDTIVTTGINPEDNLFINISVYPNPVNDVLNIKFQSKNTVEAEVKLTNILGQFVLEKNFPVQNGKNHFILEVNIIPKGIYTLRIKIGNEIFTRMVIKE